MLQVGTATAEPNRITRGHLELAQYPDGGPVLSPVMIPMLALTPLWEMRPCGSKLPA